MIMSFKVAVHLITKDCLQYLIIIFFALGLRPVFAQTEKGNDLKNLSTIQKNTPPLKKTKTYIHPTRNFTIAVPSGAELIERGKAVQVSIRSRRGYIINIQSGDANSTLSLLEMMAKLEKKYLGMGKPWSHKIAESKFTLAGLDAIKSAYEGAGTRVQVVIARGLKSDLVVIFFAPIENFEKLELEFKWFLTNFIPDPAELSENYKKSKGIFQKPSISQSFLFSLKQFNNSAHGFSIQYPTNWIVSKSIDKTIVSFGSEKGTKEDQIVVSIQNIRIAAARTANDVAEKALTELKKTLSRDTKNFKIIEEKLINFNSGNYKISGRQMITTYSYSGNRYRRWSVLLPRSDDTIAHIWSYTAPELQFMNFRPIADTMLKTLVISPSQR
jgi:hypothetical protein